MPRINGFHHAFFWLAYLTFKVYHESSWVFGRYDEVNLLEALTASFIAQAFMLPAKMLFTYFIIHLILDRVRKNWLRVILFVFGLMATIVIYRICVVHFALPIAYSALPETQPLFSFNRVNAAIVDITLVAGLASTIWLYLRQQRFKFREQELLKEKVEAELQFLKNQTNPHFLFNTLNNLYALALKESKQTPEAILRLSNLLRFMLNESAYDKISLKKEIEVLENYIELEKLRFGDRLSLSTKFPDQLNGERIAPLILLPLVENAFKYGAGESETNCSVTIELKLEEDLHFFVENSVGKVELESQGIGLANLKRQLDLLYPDHELSNSLNGNKHQAILKINLQNEKE